MDGGGHLGANPVDSHTERDESAGVGLGHRSWSLQRVWMVEFISGPTPDIFTQSGTRPLRRYAAGESGWGTATGALTEYRWWRSSRRRRRVRVDSERQPRQ